MCAQVKTIRRSAEEEIINRDAAYDAKIREDWVTVRGVVLIAEVDGDKRDFCLRRSGA